MNQIINHKNKYYLKTKNGYKEILSSTDTSLGLPQLSQQFIEKYIEEYNKNNKVEYICKNCNEKYPYQPVFCGDCGCKFSTETFTVNKGNIISEVLVEVKKFNKKEYVDDQDAYGYDNFIYTLKLDSQNQITIRKQKDSWSREEVEKLLLKHQSDYRRFVRNTSPLNWSFDISKWIKENLI